MPLKGLIMERKRVKETGLAGAETIVTKRALAKEGISFDIQNPEVEFLVFAGSDLGVALQNGAIDAFAVGDPNASQYEVEYDLAVLLDTAKSEGFADEYCCGAWVTKKLSSEHPDIAAAFTRAVLKASVWVNDHPEETAALQIEKNYVAGDATFNAQVLKSYNYIPSVQGGYDAIFLSVEQLSEIGILKEGTDAKTFADNSYLFFEDGTVPDSYAPEEVEQALSGDTEQTASLSDFLKESDPLYLAFLQGTLFGDCCE